MKVRLIKSQELSDLLKLYRELNPNDPELVIDNNLEKSWKQILEDPKLHCFVAKPQWA